jgi:hypothetical protein
VFEVAGLLDNLHSFPDKKKAVQNALGVVEVGQPQTQKPKQPAQPSKMVPLEYEQAKKTFTTKRFLEISEFVGKGDPKKGYGDKITGAWPYRNEAGLVEIVDIRFEGGPRKKNVVSFYWDGRSVKSKGCPVVVCGRDLLSKYPDHDIVIVEGAKAKQAAEALIPFGFIPLTWNGGTGKIDRADWSCVYGRNVFFLADDDTPGLKAAAKFGDNYGALVNDWKIVPPYEPARKFKPSGADIVEILQLISPEELAKYIRESEHYSVPADSAQQAATSPAPPVEHGRGAFLPPNTNQDVDEKGLPFRVLGVSEDGKSYYLDRHGRLYDFKLDAINKNKMIMLAPLSYWTTYIGTTKITTDEWTLIQDDIVQMAGSKDFDTDNIRGRGAWKEPDGKICFHDGKKTIGEFSPDRVFLKKPKIDIGIDRQDLPQDIVDKMKDACFGLSFESKSDAMRLLSWSVLAPFSGALEWRPQAFLTGPSSSGKSSIENFIVKPLSLSDRFNGGKTSAAGFMQNRKKDAGAVTIEEADPDTEKKKTYKEDLLSIMRQSTSDDTPKSAMGTSDQTGTTYMTRDMFIFVAISPEIESVADDNRLVRINTKKPNSKDTSWGSLRADLVKYMTDENCACLRGMVWRNLKTIKKLAEKVSVMIQERTGKDHRFAISEGTLMATYLTVWKGIKNPSDEVIKEFIGQNYDLQEPDEERDDTQEMIDRILEHRIRVSLEKPKEFNVLECLNIVRSRKIVSGADTAYGGDENVTKEDLIEFKRAINNIGITVDSNGNLAIANNHSEIKRITGKSYGYSKLLKRHKDLVDSSKNVFFIDQKGRRCTVIGNILKGDELPFD